MFIGRRDRLHLWTKGDAVATERPRCFICDQQPATIERTPRTSFYEEDRRCGRYGITWAIQGAIRHPDNLPLLLYLSAHLRQATERGEVVTVTPDNYRSLAEGHMHTPVTVIWSYRDLRNVHFDTRQYSHVVWTNPADLRTRLEARIRGTVPIPVRN